MRISWDNPHLRKDTGKPHLLIGSPHPPLPWLNQKGTRPSTTKLLNFHFSLLSSVSQYNTLTFYIIYSKRKELFWKPCFTAWVTDVYRKLKCGHCLPLYSPHTPTFKRIFGVMEGIEEQQAIPLFWLKPKEGLVGRGSALYHWSTGEIPAARYVSSQRWKLRYWPGAAKGKYTKRVLFLTFPIKSSFCKKKKDPHN